MNEQEKRNMPKPESELPDAEGMLDEEIDRVLEGVPQEAQQKIRTMMSMTMITQRISPQSELMRKMTPENIHEYIQSQDASDQRAYKDRQNARIFMLFAFALGVGTLLGLIALLRSNSELLEKILPSVLSLIAGGIGGYGLGKKKSSSDD